MNCRYNDEELKADVEKTIGIRAKDIEKIQFCGLWHIRFRAFGTDFYYYRVDSDDVDGYMILEHSFSVKLERKKI